MKKHTALWLVVVGIVAFAGSLVLGVHFGFPYPDASPEESAGIQRYANVSFVVMLISTVAMLVGLVRLFQVWLRRR